ARSRRARRERQFHGRRQGPRQGRRPVAVRGPDRVGRAVRVPLDPIQRGGRDQRTRRTPLAGARFPHRRYRSGGLRPPQARVRRPPRHVRSAAMNRARRMWKALEPYHAITYFAPETRQATDALGLKGGWMSYFGCRAAPLGALGPEPVAAMFYN